jgi:hypothetical protein
MASWRRAPSLAIILQCNNTNVVYYILILWLLGAGPHPRRHQWRRGGRHCALHQQRTYMGAQWQDRGDTPQLPRTKISKKCSIHAIGHIWALNSKTGETLHNFPVQKSQKVLYTFYIVNPLGHWPSSVYMSCEEEDTCLINVIWGGGYMS